MNPITTTNMELKRRALIIHNCNKEVNRSIVCRNENDHSYGYSAKNNKSKENRKLKVVRRKHPPSINTVILILKS